MTHAGNFPTSKGGKGKRKKRNLGSQANTKVPGPVLGERSGPALEGMVPRRAGRGAIPREGGGHGERWGLHLQGWVCPSTSLCRQASCFPIPGGRDVPGNTPKKLLPGGETGGQELWGHSVSLHHHHLNQLECWHHGLALGWSPPSSGVPHSQVCWTTEGQTKPEPPCQASGALLPPPCLGRAQQGGDAHPETFAQQGSEPALRKPLGMAAEKLRGVLA